MAPKVKLAVSTPIKSVVVIEAFLIASTSKALPGAMSITSATVREDNLSSKSVKAVF